VLRAWLMPRQQMRLVADQRHRDRLRAGIAQSMPECKRDFNARRTAPGRPIP
jgi:hypothetical protein